MILKFVQVNKNGVGFVKCSAFNQRYKVGLEFGWGGEWGCLTFSHDFPQLGLQLSCLSINLSLFPLQGLHLVMDILIGVLQMLQDLISILKYQR